MRELNTKEMERVSGGERFSLWNFGGFGEFLNRTNSQVNITTSDGLSQTVRITFGVSGEFSGGASVIGGGALEFSFTAGSTYEGVDSDLNGIPDALEGLGAAFEVDRDELEAVADQTAGSQ